MTNALPTSPIAHRRDVFTTLWHFCTSSRWAALLLALLALTATASAAWLMFGPAGSPAVFTPAAPDFTHYRALWLRLLLSLFAFSLLLRLADRLEVALHLPRHLPRARSLYAGEPSGNGSLPHPVEQLTDVALREMVKAFPGGRLYRVWQATEADCNVVYVERLRFAVWGDVALHLGCLVVIAGLFVAAQWSWRETNIDLAVGETRAITPAPGYVVTLESTRATAGRHQSRVTLTAPNGETRHGTIAPARPWLAWPFILFQTATGPALRLVITGAEGKPVLLQTLAQKDRPAESVALKFSGNQDAASVSVPALGLTVRVDHYASLPEEGYGVPVYLIQAYQGSHSTPLFSRYIWQDDAYTAQGNTFKMSLEDYAIFNAAGDPGWIVIAAGTVLLVGGAILRQRPVPLLARIATPRGDKPCAVEVAGRSGGAEVAEDFLRRMGSDRP